MDHYMELDEISTLTMQDQLEGNEQRPSENNSNSLSTKPFIRILEQPASASTKFRFDNDKNTGYILGENSTTDKDIYPSIEIVGHNDQAIVLISCVTVDPPYRPHPYCVTNNMQNKYGVVNQHVPKGSTIVTFPHLNIQRIKKKEMSKSLEIRKKANIDPFKTGFDYIEDYNYSAARLCFQVFLPVDQKFRKSLEPVVSNIIYNQNSNSQLQIKKLSQVFSPASGTKEQIILLCNKVCNDVQIQFIELVNDEIVWEKMIKPEEVYKKYAICFYVPAYKNIFIKEPVTVMIRLYRPSDNEYSEAVTFGYVPSKLGTPNFKRYSNLTNPVYNQMTKPSVGIYKLSKDTSPMMGNRSDITILTDQVFKSDLNVRFFQVKNGILVWEALVRPNLLHKRIAVCIKAPEYQVVDSGNTVQVFMQLIDSNEEVGSDPKQFYYYDHLGPELKQKPLHANVFARLKHIEISPAILHNHRIENMDELPAYLHEQPAYMQQQPEYIQQQGRNHNIDISMKNLPESFNINDLILYNQNFIRKTISLNVA